MIVLTGEMRRAVNAALADGHPVISASVGDDGQPSLAFFGSAQVHGDDQLALWARDRAGGFLRRIAANPRVALLYRDPEAGLMWQFHGRARVAADEPTRSAVYRRADPREQARDPERAGAAVVIDLDRVIERGEVVMER